MALLYVSEYTAQQVDQGKAVPIAFCPAIAEYTLAIGGGSVASPPFQTNTNIVRLHSDAVCSIKFGLNPTATATNARMAQNQTEYFGVEPAKSFQVAVITNV